MSRTTLCLCTAAVLTVLSLGTMMLRYAVLGDEVRRPIGPGTWKVTLSIQGESRGLARVWAPAPLDLDRQQLIEDSYESEELAHRPPEARHPERRRVVWTQRPGAANGSFRARCEYLVATQTSREPGGKTIPTTGLYGTPKPGEHLAAETAIECSHDRICDKARELTTPLLGSTSQLDIAQTLYHFVERKIRTEPRLDIPSLSALGCLDKGGGDRLAKSRLLTALLRNRNIPARIVSGLTLTKGPEQQVHYWVEAFVHDQWLPMCPAHKHFGRVPSTYLILGFGDRPPVTGKRVEELKSAFLVEKAGKDRTDANEETPTLQSVFKSMSLYQLAAGDRRLVEVLLLLPVAALIVCIFRNIIGMHSFGTFTPALIGLAFHDLASWPGVLVFVLILLIGWMMRRALDRYHLLQVPRIAVMLTLIMSVLLVLIVATNLCGATPTRYIALFPMVILTGMVERFWTLETEDSTMASFKTLLQTMAMAMVIALVLSRPWVVRHLFCYPETLGLVMAVQLLIGRYTGYRLTELLRFRDFLRQPPPGYSTVG